jgi:hypothetical protein
MKKIRETKDINWTATSKIACRLCFHRLTLIKKINDLITLHLHKQTLKFDLYLPVLICSK